MEQEKIYFIGIGGIGMSALAQLYLSKGMYVSGSDRGASRVTDLLRQKGAQVHIGHAAKHIHPETSLVIYSDAIPQDNEERVQARALGIRECSYFEALGEATRGGTSIVISGTHGKTTTTAMVAKILLDAGKEPTVIAGSILSEYGSNFIAGSDTLYVIEGCEYRRHFLQLHPKVLIITNIELDHTDYFTDIDDMVDAFREIAQRVTSEGYVVAKTDSAPVASVLKDVQAHVVPYGNTKVPGLMTPGEFNKENARAAKSGVLALFPEISEGAVDASLSTFKGTWRRFEYKGKTKTGALVYDDYAHHPTAIERTLEMVRSEFSGKHLIVVFHPHLYSRTKDFFEEFAMALTRADTTVLLPVYAAREMPDPSVNSIALVNRINEIGGNAYHASDFTEAQNFLEKEGDTAVIVTMGAGDVYRLAELIVVKK